MGASPVNVPFPDRYTSLEKGLVEGDFSQFGPMTVVGSLPLYKYHLIIPVISSPEVICTLFNADTWNKLPPDIQKIFSDNESVYRDRYTALNLGADDAGLKKAAELGQIVSTLSPEQMQLWKSVAMPLHEQWIKDAEAKGKPGKQLYDNVQQLIAKYSSK